MTLDIDCLAVAAANGEIVAIEATSLAAPGRDNGCKVNHLAKVAETGGERDPNRASPPSGRTRC